MPQATSAQFYMQASHVLGKSGPLTKEDIATAREELEDIKSKAGWSEPTRSFLNDEGVNWRFGGPPDYTLANLAYMKGKTRHHPEGSLERIVEDLVKTWEMERSHKVDLSQHKAISQANFTLKANNGKTYQSGEAHEVGNYNVLLDDADKELWDTKNTTWEQSHDAFHGAFVAFPWEVLEVFSGPPKVAFSWRHWGHFTGEYKGNKGEGELIEVLGFGIAGVSADLKLEACEIYYDKDMFLKVMEGKAPASDMHPSAKSDPILHQVCPAFANKGDSTDSAGLFGGWCQASKASP